MRRSTAETDGNPALPARRDLASIRLTGGVLLSAVMLTALSLPARGAQPAAKNPPAAQPPAPPSAPPAKKSPAAKQPSGPPLPSGFQIPRDVPEVMYLFKPLMTFEETEEARKSPEVRGFTKALWAGEMSNVAQAAIRKAIKYRVYVMTLGEQRSELHVLREKLLTDLKSAGKFKSKPNDKEIFREFVMAEVAARAVELLDNNFYVRLQAVIILSRLNLIEENKRNKRSAVAYTPASDVLIEIVRDKDQPQGIKIQAVKGLKRILEIGRPNDDLRYGVAEPLIEELENEKYCWWYRMRLAEALGIIDLFLHRNTQKPFILDALSRVLVDRKRHWVVRSQAAKSLGRARLVSRRPGGQKVDIGLIAHQIADLGRQMADGYNKSPREFYWKDCYFRLYLAFRPIDQKEKNRNAGLLLKMQQINSAAFAADKALVNGAYQTVVLPLAQNVLKPEAPSRLSKQLLDPIDTWLSTQKPANASIYPGLPPLVPGRASPAGKKPVAGKPPLAGKPPVVSN